MSTVIVDSGGANLASLVYALARLGVSARVSRDPEVIASADRVLLPGVGAADAIMQRLSAAQLIEVLRSLQCPVLGICLGMQLLFDSSSEGDTSTLGIIPGRIERLSPAPGLPVPHMGWNTLELQGSDPLLEGIDRTDRCYFVHSYYLPATHPAVIATANYGVGVAAAVRRGNFRGVQFHPERSGHVGRKILENFLRLGPCC